MHRHMCYDVTNKMHLDNYIEADIMPCSEGNSDMANKINQPVVIQGKKCWITAKTVQEFADKIMSIAGDDTMHNSQQIASHPFDEYAWNWFHTYSEPNIATVTAKTYKRQLENVLIPAFAGLSVEDISARLGFESPEYFRRVFKQHYRQSPSAFRKRIHQG